MNGLITFSWLYIKSGSLDQNNLPNKLTKQIIGFALHKLWIFNRIWVSGHRMKKKFICLDFRFSLCNFSIFLKFLVLLNCTIYRRRSSAACILCSKKYINQNLKNTMHPKIFNAMSLLLGGTDREILCSVCGCACVYLSCVYKI